jgi:hypothetical protein
MARTRTLLVSIQKLDRQGDEGVIVLRLMMACNDLTTANQALGACREDKDGKTDYIRRGAAMYFVRLQMAHLHEALKIVNEIRGYPSLLSMIDDCPGQTSDHFAQLLCFVDGGTQRGDFLKYVELVRHRVTFHYDKRTIKRALSDRARRKGDAAHLMTVADDIRRVRFQIADDLVNTLVCHHVWGIPSGTDTQIEADRIADFGFRIYKAFLEFARTFIERYVEKNAASSV